MFKLFYTNYYLQSVSLVYLWYSFFTFPEDSPSLDPQNYFDRLVQQSTATAYLCLVIFSSMLLFVSLFGYMSLTEDGNLMILAVSQ